MTRDPPLSVFPELLAELETHPEDEEHCSVAVTHESEWCLCAYRNGYVVWENLEADEPRHMTGVVHEQILRLWEALARGDIGLIGLEPWQAGY